MFIRLNWRQKDSKFVFVVVITEKDSVHYYKMQLRIVKTKVLQNATWGHTSTIKCNLIWWKRQNATYNYKVQYYKMQQDKAEYKV